MKWLVYPSHWAWRIIGMQRILVRPPTTRKYATYLACVWPTIPCHTRLPCTSRFPTVIGAFYLPVGRLHPTRHAMRGDMSQRWLIRLSIRHSLCRMIDWLTDGWTKWLTDWMTGAWSDPVVCGFHWGSRSPLPLRVVRNLSNMGRL